MCNPIAIGLAMQGAGILANKAGNDRVVRSRNSMAEAEAQRQRGYQAGIDSRFSEVLNTFRPDAQAQTNAGEVAKLDAAYQGALPQVSALPLTGSADQSTKASFGRKLSDMLIKGKDEAKRLAKLKAHDATQFSNLLGLTRSGQDIGQQVGFSQASSGILPYELQAANQKGANQRTIGELLGGAGNIAVMKGFTAPAVKQSWT